MLGDDRADRAFPWPEYEDAGALLAFSTDAPTAPHDALANMYVATTRASALDRSVPALHPQVTLPLEGAIGHATRDAAASVGDESWRGVIAALLDARVAETIVAGIPRHRAGESQ